MLHHPIGGNEDVWDCVGNVSHNGSISPRMKAEG
jgi:hypothetical protein